MKKKISGTIKRLSYTAMMLSYALMIILPLLYFSDKNNFGMREIILFIFAITIAIILFTISLITTIKFKWGNKNSFIPMV
ncbi:MAG: hypothetical protein ACXVPU_08380 [Bacteroidia bacterium]